MCFLYLNGHIVSQIWGINFYHFMLQTMFYAFNFEVFSLFHFYKSLVFVFTWYLKVPAYCLHEFSSKSFSLIK